MNDTRLVSLLVLAGWLLAGCGSGLEGDGYASGANSALTVERALQVSDDLSDFAGLSVTTAEDAAARVETQAREATMGCGTVARSGPQVTLALTSCTLPSGHVVSGAIGISASVSASIVSLAITFTDVSVDGESLEGTVSLEAGPGALTASLALLSSRGEISGDLSLLADPSMLTVSGGLEVTRDALPTAIAFTSVVYQRGDCYPSGGSLSITSGMVSTTIAFDESTASTGVVTVTQGRRTSAEMLPAYGSCPG